MHKWIASELFKDWFLKNLLFFIVSILIIIFLNKLKQFLISTYLNLYTSWNRQILAPQAFLCFIVCVWEWHQILASWRLRMLATYKVGHSLVPWFVRGHLLYGCYGRGHYMSVPRRVSKNKTQGEAGLDLNVCLKSHCYASCHCCQGLVTAVWGTGRCWHMHMHWHLVQSKQVGYESAHLQASDWLSLPFFV